MKTRLTLCLVLASASVGLRAEDAAPQLQNPAGEQSDHPTPESILARQVSEIASSSSASRKAKAKRIGSAVHLAVIEATTGVKDPDQVLRIALGLATAAAEAAPSFADVIRDAILSIPSIASIDGAVAQLQAVITAAAAAGDRPVVEFSSTPPRPPQNPGFGGGAGDIVVASPSH
jgi:hypothetical protein